MAAVIDLKQGKEAHTESDIGPSVDSAIAPTIQPTIDQAAAPDLQSEKVRVIVRTTKIGRFLLIRELGSGGMGSVYSAYDEQLDRKVALKLLKTQRAGSLKQRHLIVREARAAARVSHPNVISIYEVNEADGQIHIAMEYVEGQTLRQWQRQEKRPWRELLGMYLQIGEGLKAAHAANIVHRDFKPENVLLGKDGRPRVVDFGLAQVGTDERESSLDLDGNQPLLPRDNGQRITLTGVVAGTPGYMSPEQYRGEPIDQRSDQWSFCASLFEALYGFLPFAGRTIRELTQSVQGPPHHPPASTDVPEDIYRVLLRGLSADANGRFPNMHALLEALSLEQQDDLAAASTTRGRFSWLVIGVGILMFLGAQLRQWQRPLRHREMVLISVVMMLALLIGGLWQRQLIRNHRLHRYAWLILLISVSQIFVQRVIAMWAEIPGRTLVAFEMLVHAGNLTTASLLLFQRGRWVGLIPLTYGILASIVNVPPRLSSIVYVGCLLYYFYSWSRASTAARQKRQPGGRLADSHSGPLSRSSTTSTETIRKPTTVPSSSPPQS